MPDSIEIFDILEHEPVSKTGNEWRFICPICPDKRGKPDEEGKLYYNITKQKGYCFKCQTAFYPEHSDVDDSEQQLGRAADDWALMADPLSVYDNLQEPQEIAFDFQEVDDQDIAYLKKRNPFLVPLRANLGIHAWRGRDRGIVVPFFYRNQVVKFQTRFYERKDWSRGKYYTHEGQKPPYSPKHILNNFRLIGEDELTVCEGVYDAIALDIMGFNNPLAVLGDRLTPLQAYIFRSLMPYRVVVCLDDWERSLSMKKSIHKLIPSVQEVHIHCKWGEYKDPEEYLVGQIRYDAELAQTCKQNVIQWIKGD